MNSKLEQIGPVCFEKENLSWRRPDPALFSNISMLWNILDLVQKDWEREADDLNEQIESADTEISQFYIVSRAFIELQPMYLKCLFSYALFYVSLEKAYNLFYEQLNALNRLPFLNIRHSKPPKSNDYIKKVRLIRNLSVAHIGSKKARIIDANAAAMWQPLSLGKNIHELWDINKMSFGSLKLITRDLDGNEIDRSADMEIVGIPELHHHCIDYLKQYDDVCTDYLQSIINQMPYSDSNGRYYAIQEISSREVDQA